MKRLFIALALCIACLASTPDARAQKDTLGFAVLDSLLNNYTSAILYESVETKQLECDFLITSVHDEAMREHIARKLFNDYKDAPVMGDEAVAIYLYDKWFADGTMKFEGEFEAMDAEMFVNLNRNSLIGMPAPVLTARKPCMGKKSIPEKGKTSILWFYDPTCSKCAMEARLLPGVLEKHVDFPVTLVAFYAGTDRKAWKEFRKGFRVNNPNVRVEHYWDPSVDSDYLRLYGVFSTPRMFMVAPEGTITGRRLELDVLPELLVTAREIHEIFADEK